jgi:hypothetical protein
MRDAWHISPIFEALGEPFSFVSTPRIAIVMQIAQQVSMLSESARGVSIISVESV